MARLAPAALVPVASWAMSMLMGARTLADHWVGDVRPELDLPKDWSRWGDYAGKGPLELRLRTSDVCMHLHERPPKSVGSAFLGREGISFIDAQASSSALCDVRLHALEVHFRSGDNTPQVDTLLSLSLSSIGVLYRAHRGAAPEVLLSMLDDEEEAPAMAPVPPDTTPEVLLSMLDDEEEALATARARSPSPAYQRVNGSPAYARNYPSDEHAGLSDELSGGAGGRSGVELEELEGLGARESPLDGVPDLGDHDGVLDRGAVLMAAAPLLMPGPGAPPLLLLSVQGHVDGARDGAVPEELRTVRVRAELRLRRLRAVAIAKGVARLAVWAHQVTLGLQRAENDLAAAQMAEGHTAATLPPQLTKRTGLPQPRIELHALVRGPLLVIPCPKLPCAAALLGVSLNTMTRLVAEACPERAARPRGRKQRSVLPR
jgi:hypothetical protein